MPIHACGRAGARRSEARRRGVAAARGALVLAAFTLALAGCSSSGSQPSKAGKASDGNSHYKIGVSWGNLANPAAIGEYNQVVKAVKATGATLLPPIQANNDANTQLTNVHQLIAQGAQGLIIFSVDPAAIAPALGYAASKHVPVVAVDNIVSAGHLYMDVSSNNVTMGAGECQAIGHQTHGTGQVLLILGGLATVPGQYRAQGVEDCLSKNYPNLKVIKTPSTDWDPQKAAQFAQTLIPANPNITAIGLASDGVMLPAVSKVLQSLHKWVPAGQAGHVFLDAIDGTPLSLTDIRAGYLDSTIEQPYSVYASQAAQYVLDALKGKTYHAGATTGIGNCTISTFKGNLWSQPPAPTVTKANASDPGLWGNQS